MTNSTLTDTDPVTSRALVQKMICLMAKNRTVTHGRCNKCPACRIDRRQEWTARMLFESYLHQSVSFWTLTYDEENLPDGETLVKRDCQLFLKRLRKRLAGEDNRSVRYYLSGEYGTEYGRPHYHAILYGVSHFEREMVEAVWGKGFCPGSEATRGRMSYAAKYITKAYSGGRDKNYPDGRLKEFSLMSRNPGLGSEFLRGMARGLIRQAENPDVSIAGLARVDGRKYPIDRYGRNLLQSELVDLGVPWRDAQRLVVGIGRETHGTRDGFTTASRIERQDRRLRNVKGREKINRDRCQRLH